MYRTQLLLAQLPLVFELCPCALPVTSQSLPWFIPSYFEPGLLPPPPPTPTPTIIFSPPNFTFVLICLFHEVTKWTSIVVVCLLRLRKNLKPQNNSIFNSCTILFSNLSGVRYMYVPDVITQKLLVFVEANRYCRPIGLWHLLCCCFIGHAFSFLWLLLTVSARFSNKEEKSASACAWSRTRREGIHAVQSFGAKQE